MVIVCSQCRTYMGDTDDPKRTVDLCKTCLVKWIAEERRSVNLMVKALNATYSAMDREARG